MGDGEWVSHLVKVSLSERVSRVSSKLIALHELRAHNLAGVLRLAGVLVCGTLNHGGGGLLQGYLAHKKQPPPRTLQQDYLGSYGGPWGGVCFLGARYPCRGARPAAREG